MTRQSDTTSTSTMAGTAAALWGFLGVVALLGRGIWRLVPPALEILRADLTPLTWAATACWIAFMAYSEGYRGFQRSFSPRVVARAVELARAPTVLRAVLAPLYCMSLFAAARRRMIVGWCLLVGIVILVLAVSRLAQPWRGIVDAGVVVGLSWGLVSLVVLGVKRSLPTT